MAPENFSKVMDCVRFAGRSPDRILAVAIAVLLVMPAVYVIIGPWSLILLWAFLVCQLVLVIQGLCLLYSCGLKPRRGALRCYGIYLVTYGTASIAMTFFFVALATFGGPSRDYEPLFMASLWGVAAAMCVPAGLLLQRRGHALRSRAGQSL